MSGRFDETACPTGPEVSFEDAWQFIIKVGVAAQKYGCTAIRLEAFLTSLSVSLGFSGVFRVTPSGILFALREGPGLPQRIELVDTPNLGLDLDKLARLGDLLDEIRARALSFADAAPRLDAIDRETPP